MEAVRSRQQSPSSRKSADCERFERPAGIGSVSETEGCECEAVFTKFKWLRSSSELK